MPAPEQPEISFPSLVTLRENILSWISRDVGLSRFLIPEALATDWTEAQKQTWTNAVVDNFLRTDSRNGQIAREHVLSCETASWLRRNCRNLRQHTADYRDVIKASVALENLWNDVSTDLEDRKWAKCSLLFDTAMITLRVAYLLMYLKAEGSGPSVDIETRKTLCDTLVTSFFSAEAPTDEKLDKHSTNFKRLLAAWREELQEYSKGENFESSLRKLEKAHGPEKTASCIESFLAEVGMDKCWVLDMRKLEAEVGAGEYVRRRSVLRRSRPPQGDAKARRPFRTRGAARLPSPPLVQLSSPSESSIERASADSDFDVENAKMEDVVATAEDVVALRNSPNKSVGPSPKRTRTGLRAERATTRSGARQHAPLRRIAPASIPSIREHSLAASDGATPVSGMEALPSRVPDVSRPSGSAEIDAHDSQRTPVTRRGGTLESGVRTAGVLNQSGGRADAMNASVADRRAQRSADVAMSVEAPAVSSPPPEPISRMNLGSSSTMQSRPVVQTKAAERNPDSEKPRGVPARQLQTKSQQAPSKVYSMHENANALKAYGFEVPQGFPLSVQDRLENSSQKAPKAPSSMRDDALLNSKLPETSSVEGRGVKNKDVSNGAPESPRARRQRMKAALVAEPTSASQQYVELRRPHRGHRKRR